MLFQPKVNTLIGEACVRICLFAVQFPLTAKPMTQPKHLDFQTHLSCPDRVWDMASFYAETLVDF